MVAWTGHVVQLVLEKVIAPRSISITVKRHCCASTSCGNEATKQSTSQSVNQPNQPTNQIKYGEIFAYLLEAEVMVHF